MKKYMLLIGSAFSLALICATSSAQAQSVDYGSLQNLFGEPVTTSATGTPQRASEVAANMDIISADQIRQSGARSIPQIIGQYVPGVDVLEDANGDYDVGVRGYQQIFQPRMLVLIDGRQVFVDDYSRTIWNNLPVNIDDIRQIEVVKGPASALFGSNAASGVINIVTYSPDHDNNNVASISMGTQDLLQGDATVTKNGEWGGTKFSAGGYNADEFNTPRAASDEPNPYNPDRRYISNRSVVQLAPGVQANGEFTYADSRQNVAVNSLNALEAEKTATYSVRGGIAAQSDYGLITSDTYLNHTYDTLLSIGYIDPSTLTTTLIVSNLDDQFKLGSDDTFHAGIQYRHKDFQFTGSTFTEPGQPATAENNYAVDGTWQHQFTDALSWTSSLRGDHQDMQQTGTLPAESLFTNSNYGHDINSFSANSALVYKATDMDTLHVTYGRGVQMPSLLQSGLDVPQTLNGVPLRYEGNPYLKPTITQAYELGDDHKIPGLFSTAKIAVFCQLVQDITDFMPSSGLVSINGHSTLLSEAENIGNSNAYGGELEFLGDHAGFRWDASYSLARVTDTTWVLSAQDYQGSAPEHQIRLNGGYTYQQWEFDANSQIVSSTNFLRDTKGSGAVPVLESGYMSVGGRIGYDINKNLTIGVSGTNLDHHYLQASPYPAIERQAMVTLTGKF